MRMKIAAMVALIVVTAAGVANAGWFTNLLGGGRTVQTYLPVEFENSKDDRFPPRLYVHTNGILSYCLFHPIKEAIMYNGANGPEKVGTRTMPLYWDEPQARSVFYDPATRSILVLTADCKTRGHAYKLNSKADAMATLLASIATNYQAYSDYIDSPTPEKESKIKALADVAAALASVEDHAMPKERKSQLPSGQQAPLTEEELEQLKASAEAKMQEIIQEKLTVGTSQCTPAVDPLDLRKTGIREQSFDRFVQGEGMTRKIRGNMFAPHATAKEAAAGATTKVQLYYVGAWLNAIAHDYRPRVFSRIDNFNLATAPGKMPKDEYEMAILFKTSTTAVSTGKSSAPAGTTHFGTIVSIDGDKATISDEEYLLGSQIVKTDTPTTYAMKETKQTKGMLKLGELQVGYRLQYKLEGGKAVPGFVYPVARQPLECRVKKVDAKFREVDVEVLETGETVTLLLEEGDLTNQRFLEAHRGRVVEIVTQQTFVKSAKEQR